VGNLKSALMGVLGPVNSASVDEQRLHKDTTKNKQNTTT
jgi:hypothetical protein